MRRGLGRLLVGLLIGLVLPLHVEAQKVHLSETYTSPNIEQHGSFGSALVEVGDVNNDGTSDFLVGAPGEDYAGTDGAGRAYLFDGSNGEVLRTLSSPDPEKDGGFGYSAARAGDINSDGTPDLFIGADGESPGGGRAYLFDGASGEVLHTLSSPNPEEGGFFGYSVAGAGDINGDGTPDLFVGAKWESPAGKEQAGRAYLFDGASGEVLRTLSSPNSEEGGRFGESVARAGNVNGDGTPDLLVGASSESPGSTDRTGRAYLFDGASGEVLRTLSSPTPDLWGSGSFGDSVAPAGDINGDGTPDLLVGAPGQDRAYLIDGTNGEVLHNLSSPYPNGQFGHSVAGAGDINGDGTPELLVGANIENPGGTDGAGRAYLIDGSKGEVLDTLSSTNPEESGEFGDSIARIGNTNGDGTPDLLVGAPWEGPDGRHKAGRVYRFEIVDETK